MEVLSIKQKLSLLKTLTDLTDSGKITWLRSPGESASFRCTVDRFIYLIQSRDGDDSNPYRFIIFKVDTNEDTEILDGWMTAAGDTFWEKALSETVDLDAPTEALYILVRDKVLGINEAVGDMFKSLNDAAAGSNDPAGFA
jgi:hypothetical protein